MMPALIASGNPGQAATTAARSGLVLQVSVGKWWTRTGAGCRKSFDVKTLEEPGCGLIIHHQSLPGAALTIAMMPALIASGSSGQAAAVVPIARAAPRARQGTLPTGLRVAETL